MDKCSLVSAFLLLFCILIEVLNAGSSADQLFSKDVLERLETTGYYRLNTTVLPLNYTIRMRPVLDDGFPNLKKFTAPNSSVAIRVQSISNGSSNTIFLHQRNLTIHQDHVVVTNLATGKNMTIESQSFDPARDLYKIELKESFHFGEELEIRIPYDVELSQTENVGIYLGHYVDNRTNQTKYLSATKLEPYHARKVFPAFDEPSLKATFKIIIGRLDGKYHSRSNMEITKTEIDPEYEGWVFDHYEDSILMSPYLVCMIVSDFANATIEIPEKNRTVSTWAIKQDIDEDGGVYGAATGAQIIDYFENKFKMEYPLRKLDAAALPQFASGAMEQFGLVTYRYAYLVWTPGENTEAERRKVTQVLSHEIAHQWYGNIVTCAWWSEIWLNEGFARYLQFWAMNATIPEFEIENSIVHDTTQLAMIFDQSPQTHPVKNSAESPLESASVFDRISYEKAAALLNMMEAFLSRPVFEAGIIDIYLQRMKWKSAFQDDLFEALQDAAEMYNASYLPSGVSVKELMAEWTITSGYPLVRVNIVDRRTISVSQEEFSLDDDDTIDDEDESNSWWVPVKVVPGSSNRLPDLWIPNNLDTVNYTSEDLDTSRMVMVNPDAIGYFRVLYDDRLTQMIRQQLSEDHSKISSISRSQLIDDYFNLALADYIDIESALDMTQYLGQEFSSNVWTTVLTHLKPILSKFTQNPNALDAFKNYTLPRLTGALEKIGVRQLSQERGINVTLRAQLLDIACQLDMSECVQYAKELMNLWRASPRTNPFPVDIRSSLICTAIATSSSNNVVWDFVYEQFLTAQRDSRKLLYLNALSCSRNETILSSLLQMSLDNLSPLSRYTSEIVTTITTNPLGRSLSFDFVKNNLRQQMNNQTEKKITPEIFASTVAALSFYWNSISNINELERFIESNQDSLEPVKPLLQASMKNIQVTIDWWIAFGDDIQSWMERQELSKFLINY